MNTINWISKWIDPTSYIIWKWRKEKEIREYDKLNKRIDWPISRYIWYSVSSGESYIETFVQIRLTQQWSSFSRMILWWSDCSASMIVYTQLFSNVILLVYDEKKSLSKLLRQLLKKSYMNVWHENERFAYNKTSQMAKKWMRLKMFQLTHTYIN